MKVFKALLLGLVALMIVVAVALFGASRKPSLHTEGAVRAAVDAYIYGILV